MKNKVNKLVFFIVDVRKSNSDGYNKPNYDTARERGYKFYWTGEQCINGHLFFRYTSNRACRICSLMNNDSRYGESTKNNIRNRIELIKESFEEDWWEFDN